LIQYACSIIRIDGTYISAMNLTLVLAFHRVATAGSFTSAAAASGVSQPTLSAQVRKLEATIGAALFERAGRRIHLTPLGQQLHAATRRLAAVLDEIETMVKTTRSETRGSLRVCADSAIHVLPVLARLKRHSSAFRFSIRISNSAEVITQVLEDRADVGVTARSIDDARLHAVKIRDDRLVVMVAAGDPLAGRRRLHLGDLAGRDLVVRERGSITREVAERALVEARVAKGDVLEVATREAVREAVAAGFGYGLVFASEAGPDDRLAEIAIAGADVGVAEFVICRADRRDRGLVARFLEVAARYAGESGWLTTSARRPSRREA
jgi:aminoethylphosphonate catabolism LysR family transcriptional regulator